MPSIRTREARALAVLVARSAALAGLLVWSAALGGATAATAAENEPPAGVRVLRTGGLDLELAALLLSGQEGGPLPIAVFAAPTTPAAAGGAETLVAVEVEGAALLAAAAERLHLDVCIYALRGNGPEIAASVLETIEVDVATQRERLASGGVRVVRRLRLPAGEHSLRVLVRNRATRELGLRVLPLAVPSFAADQPVLHGPFFASAAGAWLDPGDGGRGAAAAAVGSPSALPVLAVGTPARLQVVASATPAPGPFEVQLEHGAEVLATLPATIDARAPLAGGVELLTLVVKVPALPRGVVDLRVRGGGATLGPMRVVLTNATAEPPTWAALLAGSRGTGSGSDAGGAGGAEARATPPPPRRDRRSEREWPAAYRRALQQLTGDHPEAAAAVVAFESQVLAAGVDAVQELVELELAVLGELARKDAEALWPVMALYLQRHREHVAARATATAWHAQRMVLAVADLYAGAAAPPSRRLAAVAMLAFVADLPPGRERFLRIRALEAAHRYDPENVGALLCSAVDAERFGDHEQAIRALATLRRVDADNFEARLRLGINHARQGAQRAARGALREAIDGAGASSPPPWWLPVAYQELGRLYVEGGDLRDAEAVLRQGLGRLPRDEKLSLLLALVLAKRGDREGARAVLDAVTPAPLDRGFDSARHRYMQLPEEPLVGARDELQRLAAAARPRLAAALAGTAGSEVSR